MDRTSQWVSSPDIPADLLIRIADDVFPLLKGVMVPKCGYIRKAVAAARGGATATVDLDLSALPGGADAFDKAARYCYGANFEISVRNAAALLCAAAFLDMHPTDGGLARRVEEFLAKVGLRTLPGAVAVLRYCEGLLPAAEEIGVVQRSADAIALRICNEVLFPTRSPPEWWTAELAALSPASFHKVITALRSELARMRAYVSGMQQQSKGSSSSRGKKGSWLRTLSRLNPFKAGIWGKDTSGIVDGKTDAMNSVKSKRRRFSIS
uniref:RPT2, putative, expressed n=1 Tax=Oryza sativa subsp. japonica TaxID=39947 RepID=H2KWW1_ORYSJ|nr:RPT2, putative, expressed [Oryza sativa Japonica Group]